MDNTKVLDANANINTVNIDTIPATESSGMMKKMKDYIDIIMSNKIYLLIIVAIIVGIGYYFYNKKNINSKNKEIKKNDEDTEHNEHIEPTEPTEPTEPIKHNEVNEPIKHNEVNENNMQEIMEIQKYLIEQTNIYKKNHQELYSQLVNCQEQLNQQHLNQQHLNQQQLNQQQITQQLLNQPVHQQVQVHKPDKIIHPDKNQNQKEIESDSDSVNLSDNELESLKKQLAVLEKQNSSTLKR